MNTPRNMLFTGKDLSTTRILPAEDIIGVSSTQWLPGSSIILYHYIS